MPHAAMAKPGALRRPSVSGSTVDPKLAREYMKYMTGQQGKADSGSDVMPVVKQNAINAKQHAQPNGVEDSEKALSPPTSNQSTLSKAKEVAPATTKVETVVQSNEPVEQSRNQVLELKPPTSGGTMLLSSDTPESGKGTKKTTGQQYRGKDAIGSSSGKAKATKAVSWCSLRPTVFQ